MAAAAFVANTGAYVALAAAATAKSVLSVTPASGKVVTLTELSLSFDGVSAGDAPVLVELCSSSAAGAGTSTSVTPARVRGSDNATVTAAAAKNYTAEPTVLTPLREWLVSPTSGLVVQFPLGREAEVNNSKPLVVRVTIKTGKTTAAELRGYLEWEE